MSRSPIHDHVQEHVDLIARHEQEFLARRTLVERLTDRIAAFIGSLKYVTLHLILFAVWVLWNLPALKHLPVFDPFPYPILNVSLALEAILVASFILMRQQRISRRSEERDQLMLQVLLLSEREVTAILGIEQRIAERMGLKDIAADDEISQLSEHTPIDDMSQVIQETLPLE